VPNLYNVQAIAAGAVHTCALLGDNTVACWGYNNRGQLGNGTTTNSASPVVVPNLTAVTAISAGLDFTCALPPVVCWGANDVGQLGNGTTVDSLTPVVVNLGGVAGCASPTGAPCLHLGSQHACALLSDGLVDCWGSNTSGQLGNGTPSSYSPTPVQVSNLSGVTAISTGAAHSCALSNGSLMCWGDNTSDQLGANLTSLYSATPVPVVWNP
jgi:alpha-tubulin suppressor-like RCC1 family protein